MGSAFSQIYEPVKWDFSINEKSELVLSASIEQGWHIYNLTMPEYGPNPTIFSFEKLDGAQLTGEVFSKTPLLTKYDEMFAMDVGLFEDNTVFIQKFKLNDAKKFAVEGYINYTSCAKKNCITLTQEFSFTKNDLPAALQKPEIVKAKKTKTADLPKQETKQRTENIIQPAVAAATETEDLWLPVIDKLNAFGALGGEAKTSFASIFLICFGGGFLALLMPCIWPIIPLTVSFFLKRSKSKRKKAVVDAIVYGLFILIIYLAFGLLITLIFGANTLNNLATNAVFNVIGFALLGFYLRFHFSARLG
jgi:thiol:disulfide interchange protein DsbD